MTGLLLVLGAAGCGGGGSVITTTTVPAKTATPKAAADCLNSDAFLVEADGRRVRGSSPGGVDFTATFYASADAANAAVAQLDPAYSAVIAKAVVDYSGNPPPHPGAPPMKLIDNDLRTLRLCIEVRPPG